MHISLPVPGDQMPTFIEDHQAGIAALLIGNRQPEALTSGIITRIGEANGRLNEKSNFEHLLVNRGGLVYLTPRQGYRSPHPERFIRSLDISELALYTNAFLDFASDERRQSVNQVDFLLSKIETWITAPDVIFASSTTSKLLWDVLSEALSLTATLEQWKRANGANAVSESKRDLFRGVPKDWWLIPDLPHYFDDLKAS
jgi:hypothetical protein